MKTVSLGFVLCLFWFFTFFLSIGTGQEIVWNSNNKMTCFVGRQAFTQSTNHGHCPFVQQPWVSCLYLCASVIKQYNVALAKLW